MIEGGGFSEKEKKEEGEEVEEERWKLGRDTHSCIRSRSKELGACKGGEAGVQVLTHPPTYLPAYTEECTLCRDFA